jgi:hypothetical protein
LGFAFGVKAVEGASHCLCPPKKSWWSAGGGKKKVFGRVWWVFSGLGDWAVTELKIKT